MLDYSERLREMQEMVEAYLKTLFLRPSDQEMPGPEDRLLESMRYSLLAGGKRLRPVLCMAFCQAVGGEAETALPAGAAIEMIHTYSLIHDDLPCMDNDDFRRGKPTNHKVYGETLATLAGDALQPAAFRVLSGMEAPPERVLACVTLLAEAAGERGMVAGQVLDMDGETRPLTEAELRRVHTHKTGDMIRAACQMGAVLGGGSSQQIALAGRFGLELGMAFQIRDDMLDCIGSDQELGKPIGSDRESGKTTFVTLLGLEACQAEVERTTQKALDALNDGNSFRDTAFLTWLARSLTQRMK